MECYHAAPIFIYCDNGRKNLLLLNHHCNYLKNIYGDKNAKHAKKIFAVLGTT